MRRVLAVLLSLAVMMSAAPAYATLPEGWYTRGGQLKRTSMVEGDFGFLSPTESFRLNTGLSASQALNVDGKIYHMGGNALYEIDPMVASQYPDNEAVPPTPGANPGVRLLATGFNDCVGPNGVDYCAASGITDLSYRPSSSGLTYRTINGKRVLYFGTGNNRVCAFGLDRAYNDPNRLRCAQLGGTEPIVSTPLVFEAATSKGPQDVVIMGDKAGQVWIIQNLAGDGPFLAQPYWLGGWVTASPSWSGDNLEFVVAADGTGDPRGNGKVVKWKVLTEDPGVGSTLGYVERWYTYTPNGVADGVSVDEAYGYVSDTKGNLYRIRHSDGSSAMLPWSDVFPGESGVFANQLAALDNINGLVYFAIRYVGVPYPGAQPQPGVPTTGAIVAVDKNDWSKPKWVARLDDGDGAAATPLAWPTMQGLVVAGSTNGYLYGFDALTGNRKRLAFQNQFGICAPQVKLDLLERPVEVPYRSTHTYQQLNGAGTEPSLALSGTDPTTNEPVAFLVTGVNYERTDTGEKNGRLIGYRTTGIFNTLFDQGEITDESGGVLVHRGRGFMEVRPEDKSFYAPGQLELLKNYTVTAKLAQEGLDGDRTFGLWWFYVNQAGTYARLLKSQTVHANRNGFDNGGEVSIPFVPQPGEAGPGWIIGVVNPGEIFWLTSEESTELVNMIGLDLERRGTPDPKFDSPPVWNLVLDIALALNRLSLLINDGCFTTYPESELITTGGAYGAYLAARDNFLRLPIMVTGADLSIVSATAPPNVPWSPGGAYNVNFVVENGMGVPIQTDWRAVLDGVVIASGVKTWNPGTTGNSVTFTVPISRGGRSYVVDIEINHSRVVGEDRYDNNARSVVTVVGPEPQPPPPDTWDNKPTEEMLVPTDCTENSDPTAPEPCTDYPNLTAPWYCVYNPGAPECRGYTDDGVWYEIPGDD